MPEIGEMRYAKALGKSSTEWYKWMACPDCSKERWIIVKRNGELKGRSRSLVRRCKVCSFKVRRGENHPRWKSGHFLKNGYIFTLVGEDGFFAPMSDKSYYVQEHRLVMAKHLNRNLHPWEIVHHKNHIRDDNRIENLQLVTELGHKQLRQLEREIETLTILNSQLRDRVAILEGRITLLEAETVLNNFQTGMRINTY